MDSEGEVNLILEDYMKGNLSPDECFCMVLSLIGYDSLQLTFLARIDWTKRRNNELYNQLCNVFHGYFESKGVSFNLPDRLDCAVENGFYANDSTDANLDNNNDPDSLPSYGSYDNGLVANDDDSQYEMDLNLALKLSLESAPKLASFGDPPRDKTSIGAGKNACGLNIQNGMLVNTSKANVSMKTKEKDTDETVNNNEVLQDRNDLKQTGKKKRKNKKKQKNTMERPLSNPPVIVWFRRDLRIYDNPALVAASQTGAPVIPVFLWSDKEEGPTTALANGGATKYWLHMALPTLNQDLIAKYSNSLIFKKADSYQEVLLDIFQSTGARALIMNDVYEPYLKDRDDKICKTLQKRGIKCERFHSYLLHQPGSIQTESLCMRGIGSVTHFMECCRQCSTEPLGFPVDPPGCLPLGGERPDSDPLETLGLGKLPRRKDGTIVSCSLLIMLMCLLTFVYTNITVLKNSINCIEQFSKVPVF